MMLAHSGATMKARIYRNVVILPADKNASGIRWTARLHNGDRLRADTLQGIRQMIRNAQNRGCKHETVEC